MKKLVPFIVLISFFCFVFFVITKTKEYTKVYYVNTFDTKQDYTLKVCVLNKEGKLVLVDVEKHNNENLYTYILKLYDHYRNNLPLEYKTPLNGNFEVIKLEKKEDELFIELDMLYLNSQLDSFFTSLCWSYKDLGIKKINMSIDCERIILNTNVSINAVFEDTYFKTKQVIYYENDNEIIPVTYYHSSNKLEFLINKIKNKYGNIEIKYEIFDNLIIIDIDDENELLSESIIKLFILSLEELTEFDNIIIIVNDTHIFNN